MLRVAPQDWCAGARRRGRIFFFQAEDGIRDYKVTGVQTCALPISMEAVARRAGLAKKTLYRFAANREDLVALVVRSWTDGFRPALSADAQSASEVAPALAEIDRKSVV